MVGLFILLGFPSKDLYRGLWGTHGIDALPQHQPRIINGYIFQHPRQILTSLLLCHQYLYINEQYVYSIHKVFVFLTFYLDNICIFLQDNF